MPGPRSRARDTACVLTRYIPEVFRPAVKDAIANCPGQPVIELAD